MMSAEWLYHWTAFCLMLPKRTMPYCSWQSFQPISVLWNAGDTTVHFESLHLPLIGMETWSNFFDVVDRILRQQKEAREEARAAAESKAKENQINVHPLHPLGAGIKQLPDSDSHDRRKIGSLGSTQLERLTALGRGSMGSAASPPQVPSSSLKPSENLTEYKSRTPPISGISSSSRSSSSNPAVTPLSHISAFMVLWFLTPNHNFYSEQHWYGYQCLSIWDRGSFVKPRKFAGSQGNWRLLRYIWESR